MTESAGLTLPAIHAHVAQHRKVGPFSRELRGQVAIGQVGRDQGKVEDEAGMGGKQVRF